MTNRKIVTLFPCSLVVLPHETIHLEITNAEERAILSHCLSVTGGFFGIMLKADEQGAIGCGVRITKVIKNIEAGTTELLGRGEQRFKVLAFRDHPQFQQAQVEFIEDAEADRNRMLENQACSLHRRLLELVESDTPFYQFPDHCKLSFILANEAGLNLADKQHLLELTSENLRLAGLIEHYERIIPKMILKREQEAKTPGTGRQIDN
jgi:Lon protease-like protein